MDSAENESNDPQMIYHVAHGSQKVLKSDIELRKINGNAIMEFVARNDQDKGSINK